MRSIILAAAAVLALPTMAPADTFIATYPFTVDATGPQEFRVNFATSRFEIGYWCAAGEFVTRALDLPNKTRIYRASPVPRAQGEGVLFTLDPAAGQRENGLSTFGGDDDGSVSAGQALNFCADFVFDTE
jgi:hypothetical protein